jgi:threonine dehydrogenase-like Zn-dependent dehydrogenase
VRGLVLAGREKIEFRSDLPDPAIKEPGDAILAVRRAGICGSDLHPYLGREPTAWGLVAGHEASGEIVEVGSDVRLFSPGDRVFLPFTTSCGVCPACVSGLSSRCEQGRLFGWGSPDAGAEVGLHGTQAERVRVPLADTTLVALPPDLDFDDGVLLGDNFTTGFYCARQGGIAEGEGVVVIGCGAVGLSALVSALALGAGSVVAVDPVRLRRETALRLGADIAVVPSDAPGAMPGARVVLEAVGSRAARRLAWQLVAPGGTVSSVGVATDDLGVSAVELYDRNLTWRSGRCPVRSLIPEIMLLLDAGTMRIPTDELVNAVPGSLEDGPQAYRRFASREGSGLKPLLAP